MSKTRGNTMDPLDLLEKYGTDALRFALTTGTAPGNDLRFTENRLEAGRNYANKIWNASRFVISQLEGCQELEGWSDLLEIRTREENYITRPPADVHLEDRWIFHRINQVTSQVNAYLEEFQLGSAQSTIYQFFWTEFCDWYIEMAKVRIRFGDSSPLRMLAHVLERTLRLLHPFMPFITEEIWQKLLRQLPKEGDFPESIMVAPFPTSDDHPYNDHQADNEILIVILLIQAIRNARAQLRIPTTQQLEVVLECPDALRKIIQDEAEVIRTLARVEPLSIVQGGIGRLKQGIDNNAGRRGMTLVVDPLVVRLPLDGVVDLDAEGERLRSELADCARNLERVEKLVSNPNFREKARPDVVQNEEARLSELRERKQRLDEILEQLGR